MAVVNIRIADMEPVKSALGAAAEVAKKWEAMHRCYHTVDESNELGDLLDALSDTLTALASRTEQGLGETG